VGILGGIVLVLLIIDTVALVGLILIQRGKGGGLAAFGGGGVEQAFGTRATTLAQKATAVLGAIYLLLAIVLGLSFGTSRMAVAPAPEAPANTAPEKAPAPAPAEKPVPSAPSIPKDAK
jgi:preprotein translocase subunit SecG